MIILVGSWCEIGEDVVDLDSLALGGGRDSDACRSFVAANLDLLAEIKFTRDDKPLLRALASSSDPPHSQQEQTSGHALRSVGLRVRQSPEA